MAVAHSVTLNAMQNLGDGDFHTLADHVLRYLYPELRSLRSHGINKEGKAIKGVPDSYVGPCPEDCLFAAEYTTTQSRDLGAKFERDLRGVVTSCKNAQQIFLATNRPFDAAIDAGIQQLATTFQRKLVIVWGNEIARVLDDERQDLRQSFLGIPLEALTSQSMVPHLSRRVRQSVNICQPDATAAHRIHRRSFDTRFRQLDPSRRTGITLILGEAGLGKSTWSGATALDLARTYPTVWLQARAVPSGTTGIDLGIINACYGIASPDRVLELVQVLRSSQQWLLVFVDALDEVGDYAEIQGQIQHFQAHSALARMTHLIVTCRTEALETLERLPRNRLPKGTPGDDSRRLSLEPLRQEESEHILRRLGADPNKIAKLRDTLPKQFFGNPLYLTLAHKFSESHSAPPKDTGSWAKEFAESFVTDIQNRMRTQGAAPSKEHISHTLGELALCALRDPQGCDPDTLNSTNLIDQRWEGEATFLERACQSGLLVRNGSRLRFCHSLLSEWFAAASIAAQRDVTSEAKVQVINRLPSRLSVAEFAIHSCPELLGEIIKNAPALTPNFAGSILSETELERAFTHARQLLSSSSPAERGAARRILASISTHGAFLVAAEWFNALGEGDRRKRFSEAAELFLDLGMPGAVHIAACHYRFRPFRDGPLMAWYAPEFAQKLVKLSPAFHKALTDHAHTGLCQASSPDRDDGRFTMILAYLKDNRLVDFLEKEVQRRPLHGHEHRALVHLNSERAMEVYVASRGRYYDWLAIVDQEADGGIKYDSVWSELVPRQGDVRQFPHDAILRLTREALRSSDERDRSFGIAWANLLCAVELVDDFAQANKGWRWNEGMIAHVVKGLDSQAVVRLYETVLSLEAKRQIAAAAGSVPGHDTELLLLAALEDESTFDAACFGIITMRSQAAGGPLRQRLKSLEGRKLFRAIDVLGRIQYAPALSDLADMLRSSSENSEAEGVEGQNLRYHIVGAIGQIGGTEGYDILADCASEFPERVFSYLLHRCDSYALRKVHEIILAFPDAKRDLPDALARDRFLFDDVSYGFFMDEVRVPFLRDMVLLKAVLDATTERTPVEPGFPCRPLGALSDCDAISLFDLPEASAYLQRLAEKSLEGERTDVQMAVEHAQLVLARRGDPRWIKFRVGNELDRISGSRWFSDSTLESLQSWPEEIVREALLERIRLRDEGLNTWLHLLLSFANKEDEKLLHDYAPHVDPYLADAIRERVSL